MLSGLIVLLDRGNTIRDKLIRSIVVTGHPFHTQVTVPAHYSLLAADVEDVPAAQPVFGVHRLKIAHTTTMKSHDGVLVPCIKLERQGSPVFSLDTDRSVEVTRNRFYFSFY